MMKTLFLILSSLLMPFLVACGSSSSFEENNEPNMQLESKLRLNDSLSQETTVFAQAEDIEFVLTLTNNMNDVVTINFNSGQRYDFYIQNSNDEEIWRWSGNQLFIQATSELQIPAGDTVTFKQNWNQSLLTGPNIDKGNYTICGFVIGQTEDCKPLTIQ